MSTANATTPIHTARLQLIATTLSHIEADLASPAELGRLLDADVPSSWPPGEYDRDAMVFFRDKLAESDAAVGWYGWYVLNRSADARPRLIGAGGYLGPPRDGTVEIGYSLAPEYRGHGFAAELVEALVVRAFAVGVLRVIAHAATGNDASIAVLERCKFTHLGPGSEPGTVQFERRAV